MFKVFLKLRISFLINSYSLKHKFLRNFILYIGTEGKFLILEKDFVGFV